MHFCFNELKALSEVDKAAIDLDINQVESDHRQSAPDGSQSTTIKLLSWNKNRICDSDLKSAGWKRPKNAAPVTHIEPDFWIDTQDEQILTKEQVRKRGFEIGPSTSLRMIRTQSIIRSCPDGKRDFVIYILKLRNRRGGLVVDLKTALDRWIDYESPDMHSTDRSRKRNSLEKFLYDRGILANKQTFTKELQFIGHATKTDYIGEESQFFYALPVIGKPGCGFPSDPLTKRKQLLEWEKSMQSAANPVSANSRSITASATIQPLSPIDAIAL
ncbi:hypothetical protein PQR57_40675 [Paraburkholderia dipogonis]|uniref:Uncharacterized protein n=1 Tax=Paraburkholderia dipogonis TaxID=1211383 RepID=A0ABW9B3B9_9BURK